MENMNNAEQIIAAINFLNQNGYVVRMNLQKYINKWIAFTQRGMEPVLHGRIISVSNFDEFFYVKCKNGEIKYPKVEDVIKFLIQRKSVMNLNKIKDGFYYGKDDTYYE